MVDMKPMLVAASIAVLCLPSWAQAPAGAAAEASAAARAELPAAATVPQRGGEPQVRRIVTEDDMVRIDELRVRGITRKVTVQSKLPGAPAYEIGTTTDGGDVAQDRRPAGRSLWQLLSF
jgi:hypothetical protein